MSVSQLDLVVGMVETPDIILYDPDNKSQKLVRGRSEKKVELTKNSVAPVMKDTKSSGSGGGGKSGGGSNLKKSASVKTKKNAAGYFTNIFIHTRDRFNYNSHLNHNKLSKIHIISVLAPGAKALMLLQRKPMPMLPRMLIWKQLSWHS